jgi:hypothetical protein
MHSTSSEPIDLTSDRLDRTKKPNLQDDLVIDPSFKSPNERPLEDEDLVYYVADTRTAYTFRRYNWQVTKDSSLAERLLSVMQARNIYQRKVITNKGLTNKQMEQASAPLVPVLKKWRDVRSSVPKLVLFFYNEFDRKLFIKEMNAAKNQKASGVEDISQGGLFARAAAKKAAPLTPAPEVSDGTELRTENEAPKVKRERKPKAD